ncbi:MAG: sugar phosphate isomerase/epimerase family protein [bacterium]
MDIAVCTIAYRQTGESPEQVIIKAKKMGIKAVEWWWGHLEPGSYEQRKEIFGICQDNGIDVAGLAGPIGHFNLEMTNMDQAVEKFKQAMEIAHTQGNCKIRTFAGWVGDIPSAKASDEYFDFCIKGFKKMCELAQNENLILQMETHKGSLSDSIRGINRIVQGVNSPALKLLMQIDDQCENSNTDELGFWNAIKENVVHFHFNPHENPQPGRDENWKKLFDKMKADGYKGMISIESCHNPENPDSDIKLGLDKLRDLSVIG